MRIKVLQAIPLILLLAAWQISVTVNPKLTFFFGAPDKIARYIWSRSLDGSLLIDIAATFTEAALGFIIGNVLGSIAGLSLWYSRTAFLIARPYIIALGSAPIFALAPLLIIWFGTGMFSKVMTATFSTVFVALLQSYTGAGEVGSHYLRLMQALGASKTQTFRKLIAPSAFVWVISAFKMNIGFALLGAVIGEFISSDRGLGHLILVASGLFDISLVLCGVSMLVLIAFILNFIIARIESPLKQLVVKLL